MVLREVLGRGACGVVFDGMVRGEACAIKRPAETEAEDWSLVAEMRILSQVRHKNVVKFLGKQSTSMM